MEQDKRAAPEGEARKATVQFLKFGAALCVLLFLLGGNDTRGWMLGFMSGTVSGLTGQPAGNVQSATASSHPPLKLLGHGCRREFDYQICEGEVRNETDDRLETVMAEVSFTDKNGTFIKSDSAMINYQPLMPGQTSPFTVMTINNPQIAHYRCRTFIMVQGILLP